MPKTVTFDKQKKKFLRELYNTAVKENKSVFIFDGYPLLTKYAKYLLEYLDTIIK